MAAHAPPPRPVRRRRPARPRSGSRSGCRRESAPSSNRPRRSGVSAGPTTLRRVEPRVHPLRPPSQSPAGCSTTSGSTGRGHDSRSCRRRATRRAPSASRRRSTAGRWPSPATSSPGTAACRRCTTCSGSTACPTRSARRCTRRRRSRPEPRPAPALAWRAARRRASGALPRWRATWATLAGLLAEIRRNRLWTMWPSSVDQPLTRVLPHLWVNAHSVANTYALVDDAGAALILDYGYPSWDHFFADQRFVAAHARRVPGGSRPATGGGGHPEPLPRRPPRRRPLAPARAWRAGLDPRLVRRDRRGAGSPRSALPAGRAHPGRPRPRRRRPRRACGRRLETFHMPGHTMFALGLAGTMDGVRVAYTGDNLLAGALSPLRAAAPIYRNVLRHDSIRVGVERLIAFEPELLLTGHTGALQVTRHGSRRVRRLGAGARARRRAPLAGPGPRGRGARPRTSPGSTRIGRPSEPASPARRRSSCATTAPTHAPARVRLRVPAGWSADPAERADRRARWRLDRERRLHRRAAGRCRARRAGRDRRCRAGRHAGSARPPRRSWRCRAR